MQRWRTEHAQVANEDVAINLRRGSVLCPLIAALNLIGAAVVGVQLFHGAPEAVVRWQWALLWAQIGMAILMGAFGYLTYSLRDAHRSPATRWLIWVAMATGFGISIFIASIDQWVTPNITGYVLACTLGGLAIYLRPGPSAVMFSLAYAAFFVAMGVTQSNPEQLLSNRLNGFVSTGMGWALSVLLWRNFVTMTLQQAQLSKVNTELQSKQRDLERLTRLDGLTGLYNRNTFVELTRLELDRAQRQGSATSILLLDLDHFKRVNDTWGHPAGDAVLKNVAALLTSTIRSTDLAGRLGGEEFIILLPGTSATAARMLAEKVRVRLEGNPTLFEKTVIHCTASMGLSGTTAAQKLAFDTLYNDADKALYLAKQRGRNRVV